jgi:hypothetical protein
MPISEAQKKASAKWREANKEYIKTLAKKNNQQWRNKNREHYNKQACKYMQNHYDKWGSYLKEIKRLRNIILEQD